MCKIRISDAEYSNACQYLTDEEKQILTLARRGMRYIDIAEEVGYCERTIQRRMVEIMASIEKARGH